MIVPGPGPGDTLPPGAGAASGYLIAAASLRRGVRLYKLWPFGRRRDFGLIDWLLDRFLSQFSILRNRRALASPMQSEITARTQHQGCRDNRSRPKEAPGTQPSREDRALQLAEPATPGGRRGGVSTLGGAVAGAAVRDVSGDRRLVKNPPRRLVFSSERRAYTGVRVSAASTSAQLSYLSACFLARQRRITFSTYSGIAGLR